MAHGQSQFLHVISSEGHPVQGFFAPARRTMHEFWLLLQNFAGHFARIRVVLVEICRTQAVGQKNFIVGRLSA